jgi:hypothetical protein
MDPVMADNFKSKTHLSKAIKFFNFFSAVQAAFSFEFGKVLIRLLKIFHKNIKRENQKSEYPTEPLTFC